MSNQNNNPFDPNSNFTPPPAPGGASPETPGQAQPQQWQAQPQQPQYQQPQQTQQPYQAQPGFNPYQPGPGFGDPAEMERQRLTGIGGLLLLYVILSILGLGLMLFGLPNMFMFAGIVDWLFFAGLFGLCTAGLVLIFMRKKAAIPVNIAACALTIVNGLWEAINVGSTVAAMAGVYNSYGYGGYDDYTSMATLAGIIVGILLSIVINALWLVYFLKSKRVKYTLSR